MHYNYDKPAKKAQGEIQKNVRKYCTYRYDDPETNQKDLCYLLGSYLHCNQHCIAIDSPYSYLENGKSICEKYNSLVPKDESKIIHYRERICEFCNQPYIPTSNNQKYCSTCSKSINKKADAARHRKYRGNKKKHLLNVTL